MKILKHAFLCLLLSSSAAFADQGAYYNHIGSDYKRDAATLRQYVTVEASPEWWAAMDNQGDASMRGVAGAITTFAENMGWGDAKDADLHSGNNYAPPAQAVVDGWKGKMAFNIHFPAFESDRMKRQMVLDNVLTIFSAMRNDAICHPKGGKIVLDITFNPKATKPSGKITPDGTTYHFVAPVYSWVPSDAAEAFFKMGHK